MTRINIKSHCDSKAYQSTLKMGIEPLTNTYNTVTIDIEKKKNKTNKIRSKNIWKCTLWVRKNWLNNVQNKWGGREKIESKKNVQNKWGGRGKKERKQMSTAPPPLPNSPQWVRKFKVYCTCLEFAHANLFLRAECLLKLQRHFDVEIELLYGIMCAWWCGYSLILHSHNMLVG